MEDSTIKGLQRIVLSAGRLDPDWKWVREFGAAWKIPVDPHKGEIDVKGADMHTVNDVMSVNPHDPGRKEFESVGEMRAGVGASNFFVFARGLTEAYRLASYAKAYERKKAGKDLLGIEMEMATKYEQLCAAMNKLLHAKGLPNIDKYWAQRHWKQFAVLVQRAKTGRRFKRILSKALS